MVDTDDWVVFKAVRAPWSGEVWELTLAELARCPRCAHGTIFIPFPAGGVPASTLQGADPHAMPPLDAAVFLCFQPQCRSIYLILFSAERQSEFAALIPFLREAGRRALAQSGSAGEGGDAP